MSAITRIFRQKAVLWAQGTNAPGDYGEMVTAAPVQIKCRWEERSENFIGIDNTQQVSQAVVYVDRDVAPGDVLMLGTLSDSLDATPKHNKGAHEVKGFSKIPNRKANEWLRTAYL